MINCFGEKWTIAKKDYDYKSTIIFKYYTA